jgi:hypothetical protein
MAEVQLTEGDTHESLAKALIEKAGPDKVSWSPRPDVFGGGVYIVTDEEAVAAVVRERQQRVQEDEAARRKAEEFAAERDAKASETGATPAELGFAASVGTDSGAAAEGDEDEEDSEEETEPSEPQTTAQKRAAKRTAKAASVPADTEEGK